MDILKVYDIVKFSKHIAIVKKSSHGKNYTYYLHFDNVDNFQVFKDVKIINIENFSLKIYEHEYLGGGWPYTYSLEKLTKMVNYILELEENFQI